MATFHAPPWWPSPPTTFFFLMMIGRNSFCAAMACLTQFVALTGRLIGVDEGRLNRGWTSL